MYSPGHHHNLSSPAPKVLWEGSLQWHRRLRCPRLRCSPGTSRTALAMLGGSQHPLKPNPLKKKKKRRRRRRRIVNDVEHILNLNALFGRKLWHKDIECARNSTSTYQRPGCFSFANRFVCKRNLQVTLLLLRVGQVLAVHWCPRADCCERVLAKVRQENASNGVERHGVLWKIRVAGLRKLKIGCVGSVLIKYNTNGI